MALTTLNYSRLCHNYSIYSDINREVNKDVNKKEVYNVLIFQYFEVRHVNSAITYCTQLFLNQLEAGLAKFEIPEPYVSPRKLGNNRWTRIDGPRDKNLCKV
jgi:hypothetical protein